MILDLRAELIMALDSDVAREALARVIAPAVSEAVKKAFEDHREKLLPLSEILGLKSDAARKREARDPGLAALCVTTAGRRRLYDPQQVRDYLRAAQQQKQLRVMGGGR